MLPTRCIHWKAAYRQRIVLLHARCSSVDMCLYNAIWPFWIAALPLSSFPLCGVLICSTRHLLVSQQCTHQYSALFVHCKPSICNCDICLFCAHLPLLLKLTCSPFILRVSQRWLIDWMPPGNTNTLTETWCRPFTEHTAISEVRLLTTLNLNLESINL